MLKIVVFDGGWGGEIITEFLKDELGTVEVESVIDWDHAPYDTRTLPDVIQLVEDGLQEYIGKVDLIVLGGYTVCQALASLRSKYSAQKFVGVGVNYHRILNTSNYPERVTVLMNGNLFKTSFCAELRKNLPFSTLTLPDCSDWEELSNYGELSRKRLYDDLADYFKLCVKPTPDGSFRKPDENRPLIELIREAQQRAQAVKEGKLIEEKAEEEVLADRELIESDIVLLLNTNFWDVKSDLELLFGYKTRVLDFRQKLLHDVCFALKLRGVDGKRSK